MKNAALHSRAAPTRAPVLPARPDPWFTRVARALFTPVDNSSIVLFRIAFGLIALWEVTRYFSHGWITEYYVQPRFFFKYYGFEWVRPWPGNGMYGHFYVLGFLAAAMCVGLMYRIAATLFFLGFTYVFLLDQANYLNHFYLISLISFLMIFVPAKRALSVDAYLDPELRSDTAPAWALWLLRMQIGVAYFYGGVAKLSPDWLRGEPMRDWLANRVDFPIIGRFFTQEWAVVLFTYGGLLLDLLIVPALLWRPTRKYAFAAAVTFHLLNSQLFSIGIFPWFMLFATMLFFPPDTPRRIVRKLFSKKPAQKKPVQKQRERAHTIAATHGPRTGRQKLIVGALAVYTLLQLVIPLRHFAYPGDVNWTELGHRFSWHMKLRDKESAALFVVRDPATNREWEVDASEHSSQPQAHYVPKKPDMILQFAHYLRDYYRREGYANVEVRVKSVTSVNSRKPQPMIDPEVDLSREPRTLLNASWILPLTEPLPQRRGREGASGRGGEGAIID